MSRHIWSFVYPIASALLGCTVMGCSASSFAQDSGADLALHANSHVTAADIGLPAYPGATPYKNKDNDSAVDLGLTLGTFHFRVTAASYVTNASPMQVLAFYRTQLSHYGEVIECNHGKPVGSLTVTGSGLACSDQKNGKSNDNASGNHELRAGVPNRYRLVSIEEPQAGLTRFALVHLELPEGNGKAKTSN